MRRELERKMRLLCEVRGGLTECRTGAELLVGRGELKSSSANLEDRNVDGLPRDVS